MSINNEISFAEGIKYLKANKTLGVYAVCVFWGINDINFVTEQQYLNLVRFGCAWQIVAASIEPKKLSLDLNRLTANERTGDNRHVSGELALRVHARLSGYRLKLTTQ